MERDSADLRHKQQRGPEDDLRWLGQDTSFVLAAGRASRLISVVMDPHGSQPILTAGPPVEQAQGVLVMLHGRGADAESILSLYEELDFTELAAIAPQAARHTWYPQSFLAPIEANQPYLDSALLRVESIVTEIVGR